MIISIIFFLLSFLGDFLATMFFQQFLDSGKKNYLLFVYAILSALVVWIFYFGLQARGFGLKVFMPLWASGTAVFGYFAACYVLHTSLKDTFNPVSILCVAAIGLGIFFLLKQIA